MSLRSGMTIPLYCPTGLGSSQHILRHSIHEDRQEDDFSFSACCCCCCWCRRVFAAALVVAVVVIVVDQKLFGVLVLLSTKLIDSLLIFAIVIIHVHNYIDWLIDCWCCRCDFSQNINRCESSDGASDNVLVLYATCCAVGLAWDPYHGKVTWRVRRKFLPRWATVLYFERNCCKNLETRKKQWLD